MVNIKTFHRDDYPQAKEIYQQGIDTGDATFQTSAKDWAEWDRSTLETCRLVGVENDLIIGWAALSAVSDRCVYTGVAEASVYVARDAQGQGVGNALLGELITASENAGIWTLQAGIFPENKASLALFAKNQFRILGTRYRLGRMQERWRDVVFLERRSTVVGIT